MACEALGYLSIEFDHSLSHCPRFRYVHVLAGRVGLIRREWASPLGIEEIMMIINHVPLSLLRGCYRGDATKFL